VKVSKKVEIVEPVPTSISKTKSKDKSGLKKESKKWKESDSKAVVVAEQEEEIALPASDDEEDVAALLAGFSSDEEEESDKEEGLDLEKVPKLDKKAKKALEKAKKKGGDEDTPGTIYVGYGTHTSI
jgi:nucleolar protein 15